MHDEEVEFKIAQENGCHIPRMSPSFHENCAHTSPWNRLNDLSIKNSLLNFFIRPFIAERVYLYLKCNRRRYSVYFKNMAQ